jgi:hypothetical protein
MRTKGRFGELFVRYRREEKELDREMMRLWFP